MDWTSLLPLLMMLVMAIGIPVAMWSLRRGGQGKVDELHQHLRSIGVDATVLPKDANQGEKGRKVPWGPKVVGTIRLGDGNIDSVNVVGEAAQHGVNYYLDHLVSRPPFASGGKKKKTTMPIKKSRQLKGQVADVGWKGDDFLAERLNLDFGLKDRLMHADLSLLKGSISIHPEPKHEHARIRTAYVLPDPRLLEALDMIARHVKAWY